MYMSKCATKRNRCSTLFSLRGDLLGGGLFGVVGLEAVEVVVVGEDVCDCVGGCNALDIVAGGVWLKCLDTTGEVATLLGVVDITVEGMDMIVGGGGVVVWAVLGSRLVITM